MKKVIYFGNKTSGFQSTKSTLETLEPLLGELVEIRSYSDKENKLFRLCDMFLGFLKNVRSADTVLIDVYSTSAMLYAEMIGFMSWVFHKKYMVVLHGGNLPKVYAQKKRRIRWLFDHAQHIIAPSHYLKTFFEGVGYTVELIPNIIQLEQYPFLKRDNIRPKILALRGFKGAYNPMMTVKAVEILKNQGVAVELRLLANAEEEHYEEVMCYINENELADVITVLPKQEKSVWIAASKNFDIMVSNPLIDNTPVSILEGMALGMCVITTNVGGVPYLVKDYQEVLYVDSDDHMGLANKFFELLNDAELASGLSERGRMKAKEYDWQQVKTQWKRLLL